jgi:hypothetical protein
MRSNRARATCLGGWLCAAAPSFLALGCSGDPEPSTKRVWVGEVTGTDIKVALADRGGGATALFFCGGDESYMTSTRWFAEGADLAEPFAFKDNGWSVEGALKDNRASGSVESEGVTRSWAAAAANYSTISGLYEGTGPCGKLGLIVTQKSPKDEPTGQGACVRIAHGASVVEQVNPIRLAVSALGEISVTVGSAPNEVFTVHPVAVDAK